MRALNRRKRGFTLIETVVTIGIVAAMAAVVYPQVVKQFDTADPTRVSEDLNSIKTGIETFGVNVKPLQPYDIEDLVNKIQDNSTAFDSSALGARYSATDPSNWNGPYIGISIPNATLAATTVITTGYGATIRNRLPAFDVDAVKIGGDTVDATSAASDFVSVMIEGLSGAAFNSINAVIDGPGEAASAARRGEGRFRCPYTGSAPAETASCPAAFYLAVPIRH